MRAPAKVYGDIYTPSLTIESGVIFEGRCQMENIQKKEEVILSPKPIAEEGTSQTQE